jgi:hypothetical protein
MVFLDKSAACELTADRKYGWLPVECVQLCRSHSTDHRDGQYFQHIQLKDKLHSKFTMAQLQQKYSITLYKTKYFQSVHHMHKANPDQSSL